MTVTEATAEKQKQGFSVEGMTCTACASRIQKVLSRTDGVQSVRVNFATETAGISWDPQKISEAQLLERVHKLGYGLKPAINELIERKKQNLERERKAYLKDRLLFAFSALLTLPLVLPMLYEPWMLPPFWQWILATPVQLFAGYRFYKGAYHSLKSGTGNMDVLVSLGTTVAYGYSVARMVMGTGHVYFESSAVILTLVLMGKIMERRARAQASRAMEELLGLQPEEARLIEQKDGQEIEEIVDVRVVASGDLIAVLPGERIPLDGIVETGSSETDDSLITGESVPVAKSSGDTVYAGSMNLNGRLVLRAARDVNQSSVARIMNLVEEAQNSRAPVQSLVDRVSSIFVPTVVAISLITFLGSYAWGLGFSESLIRSVAVLVIACPCALGLASPIAVVIATGMSAKNGILFRNAMALEIAGKIKTLFFDKTGTLTAGRPRVTAVANARVADATHSLDARATVPIDSRAGSVHSIEGETSEVRVSEESARLLRAAFSVEKGSEHPVSVAIREYCESNSIRPLEGDWEYRTVAGAGIQCNSSQGKILAGTRAFLQENGITPNVDDPDRGTVVHVAQDEEYLGCFTLEDTLRPGAKEAVDSLQKMNIVPLILTGDRREAAAPVAQALGIEFRAELRPEQKLSTIQDWKSGPTGMVGDGINDAPALSQADAGFAMGSGTDVASESADVTLMGSDPMEIVDAVRLSRSTIRKIYQNLFFAFVYNIIGIPLAAFGFLSPMVAGAAMAMSSVSVVVSSLTLYRFRFHSALYSGKE